MTSRLEILVLAQSWARQRSTCSSSSPSVCSSHLSRSVEFYESQSLILARRWQRFCKSTFTLRHVITSHNLFRVLFFALCCTSCRECLSMGYFVTVSLSHFGPFYITSASSSLVTMRFVSLHTHGTAQNLTCAILDSFNLHSSTSRLF